MTVSAHDVARELRRRLPDAGVVKVHKLLYYAQGWHLALAGEPLFEERIEAWANGPVVASLWSDEKHGHSAPEPRDLRGEQLATIEYVLARYGGSTGKDLIRTTHDEDPWRDVSETEEPWAFPNPEIGHKALQRWFEQDDEYVRHRSDVERSRARTDVYSFDPLDRTDDLEAAVARARSGEKVRDRRPT